MWPADHTDPCGALSNSIWDPGAWASFAEPSSRHLSITVLLALALLLLCGCRRNKGKSEW